MPADLARGLPDNPTSIRPLVPDVELAARCSIAATYMSRGRLEVAHQRVEDILTVSSGSDDPILAGRVYRAYLTHLAA